MTPLQQRIEEATAISDVRAVLDALYTHVLAPTKTFNRAWEERLKLWERAANLCTARVETTHKATMAPRRAKPRITPANPAPGPANPSPALIH